MQSDSLSELPSNVFGEIGRLLASAEMLKRGILVAKPEVDTGFDVVTFHGRRSLRIQVKTTGSRVPPSQAAKYRSKVNRFSVSARSGRTSETYAGLGIDAFVFVRLLDGEHAFWVIPTEEVNGKFYIHLRDDSEWRDAWHVLTDGGEANAT